MDQPITILGIAGSLRAASYNRAALRAAQQLVPNGARLEIFELDKNIPGFSEDEETRPPPIVARLKERIQAAGAILFATPEYNYGVPGVLKNAIDWASRPYGESAWDAKPVAVMGASISTLGSARAQYQLRQSFVFLNMPCVLQPEVMIAEAPKHFDDAGHLKNETTRQLIVQLLGALINLTRVNQSTANATRQPEQVPAPRQQESRTH